MNTQDYSFQERTLEIFTKAFEMRVAKENLHGLVPEIISHIGDDCARHLIARIRMDVAGEPVRSFHFGYPANWMEAFKERWFPMWLLKYFPIKHINKTVSFEVLYPDLKPLPNHQRVIKMMVAERKA